MTRALTEVAEACDVGKQTVHNKNFAFLRYDGGEVFAILGDIIADIAFG
jgi:hypothetical protein